MKNISSKINLYDLNINELKQLILRLEIESYRAKQLFKQIWSKQAQSLNKITDLPAKFRLKLDEIASIGNLKLEQVLTADQNLTRKAIWSLPTGEKIESVLMIYANRATVCVSSQAGCPMGCVFCATGKLGLLKNLTAGQIAEQVIWAAREVKKINSEKLLVNKHRVTKSNLPKKLTNVVFMGMGEPFNNYKNWWKSVELLHDPEGFNMGARSFTVSTVGLIPGIEKLAKENIPINLAISLHTAFDERRSALMPVNKKYPIKDLIDATRKFINQTKRRVSFEYCLIQKQNDSEHDARALATLLSKPKLLCHVNLIPWNPVKDTGLKTSENKARENFRKILEDSGIPCTIRIQRGKEIDAACGQLAAN